MGRGHWRRQRHGPGKVEVKRVRIAPALVNAARGPLAPRVYRLPSAERIDEQSDDSGAALVRASDKS